MHRQNIALVRVVCLSDTHTYGKRIDVPAGDLLIHAGDLTLRGTESEITSELEWLASLPHERKILVAGNHDWFFDPHMPARFLGYPLRRSRSVDELLADFSAITYLQDSATEIDGLRVWGSPWQPYFHGWAFNFPRELPGIPNDTWARINDDTDILITHGPPFGILDQIGGGLSVGDRSLHERIQQLSALRLHVFGHIHESYGRADLVSASGLSTTFVNASTCTGAYGPTNPPIVIDL